MVNSSTRLDLYKKLCVIFYKNIYKCVTSTHQSRLKKNTHFFIQSFTNNFSRKMKTMIHKYFLQIVGLTLFTGTLLFNACTPDDTTGGGGNEIAPQVSLVSESGYVSNNAQVELGGTFTVKLRTTPGTNSIKTITILEEGVKLSTSNFTVKENGQTLTSNNPLLVVGNSKGGSIYEITIQAAATEATKRYTFEVTDDGSLTDQVAIDITTKGAQLTELTGKLLLNQDGPEGQGGLDLDTGESVGSIATNTGNPAIDTSYKRAEINDEGNVTKNSTEWRQVISPTNGAAVRYVDKTKLPENFSYENVKTETEIISAFDLGIKFTPVMENGMVVDFESNKVQVGDVFTVKTADNRYFIIKVTKIVVTPNDNKDYYEFSIKKKKS